MRVVFQLSLAALLITSAPVDARTGTYVRAQSLSYSEPVPVAGYFNNWHTPFYGGERALTYNYAESGVTRGPWELGLVARYDYAMRFNTDTADLYYRLDNHLPLPPGRAYTVDLRVEHFAAYGLRTGYSYPVTPTLELGVGLSYLEGTELIDGTINGAATAISTNNYDYDAAVDYRYSRDVLFKRQVGAPEGRGFSLDFHLDWHSDRARMELRVTDLLAYLFWHNAPYTLANATSDTKRFDANNYVVIDPTLSGVEGNRSFTQRLPPRALLGLKYSLNKRLDAVGDIYYTSIKTFARAGLGYALMGGQAQGLYNPDTGAVTLRYRTATFGIGLTSDSVVLQTARTLGFDLRWRYVF